MAIHEAWLGLIILVVAAWVSRKCDALLVVMLVSSFGSLFIPLQRTISIHLKIQPPLAIACYLFSSLVGWMISKKSPFLGMLLFVVTILCNLENEGLNEYPFRLIVPFGIVLLSVLSRHIRYLTISSIVYGIIKQDAAAGQAICAGLILVVVHDVLLRVHIIEWISMVTESMVLVFTFLVLVQKVGLIVFETQIGPRDFALSWQQLYSLDCFSTGCGGRLQQSIPGVFCTLFCFISIIRLHGHHRAILIGVIGVVIQAGIVVLAGHQALLYSPNVSSVIAALALLLVEQISGKTTKKIVLQCHQIVYWRSTKEITVSREEVITKEKVIVKGTDLPTEEEMDLLWQQVDIDYTELERAKSVFTKYKDLAFQQEALASGMVGFDPESETKARQKAMNLNEKMREASNQVKILERKCRHSETKARNLEQKLLASGKKNKSK